MKFYLILAKGKQKGLPIPISVDLFMIGAAKECQLRCKKDDMPAKMCALVSRDKKVFVRDFSSGEPTTVNGTLVPPGGEWPLHTGDRLQVGRLEFILEVREKPMGQRDLEEWALGCLDSVRDHEYDDPDEMLTKGQNRQATPSLAAASILDRLAARRGEVHGRLRVGFEGNITVIRFNDRYLVEESEISLIHKELHDHLNRPNLRVLLDCKQIKRMSTAAIMMMDELCTWLKPWGSTLALCRVRPELQDAFKGLPLSNRLRQFPDKAAALEARW